MWLKPLVCDHSKVSYEAVFFAVMLFLWSLFNFTILNFTLFPIQATTVQQTTKVCTSTPVYCCVFAICFDKSATGNSKFYDYAPVNWNPQPPPPPPRGSMGHWWGLLRVLAPFCVRGGGGLVRLWHSWTSEDWGEWVVSMCFLIPKGGFKMDDIKVLCWFIFYLIKLRAQELFIIVLKSIKMK